MKTPFPRLSAVLPMLAPMLALASALAAPPGLAGTLEGVRERGSLRCGVNGEVPGLSFKDANGAWSGIDVDFCRALAAAVLGRADKVELVPLSTANRFDVLREGEVDVLARNTTWTLSRDLDLDIVFVGTLYFDGQGFMVRSDAGTVSALELGGKSLCALADTTAPDNARDYFTRNRMTLELKEFPDLNGAVKAYLDGACFALTADRTQLYGVRQSLDGEAAHRILPETVSKEPLSPAVRRDDGRWFDIVRWTLFTLINAEEAGVDSANADQALARARTDSVRLLLDADGTTGALLGLEKGWSHRVLSQVGNYGEIFERNLGSGSPLKIKRGINALWRDGGILYAPPAK